MSFRLKGYLAILLLAVLVVAVLWAPWKERQPGRMPENVFAPFEGEWQGKSWSYSIGGDVRDSFFEQIELESVTPDSQVGVAIRFSPARDTLARDSLFFVRRGDTLYAIRLCEDGRRTRDRGFWADGQIFWRSQDIFGRVAYARRARVHRDLWETDGFARTDRGDYLIQYSRALRR